MTTGQPAANLFALRFAVAFLLARHAKEGGTPLDKLHTAITQEIATLTADSHSEWAALADSTLAAEAAMTASLDELFVLARVFEHGMET